MYPKSETEKKVIQKVEKILKAFEADSKKKCIEIGSPEIEILNNNKYSSEVRIYFYKEKRIIDALEFFVYENDQYVLPDSELEIWLKENISKILVEN